MSIIRIDTKEFREKGYLQELNRQFLHPLGLALEVIIEENGKEKLGGIWDYRDDPEGIIFDFANRTYDLEDTRKKQNFVQSEFDKRKETRTKLFGSAIEPIPERKYE
jgi:hypothetical protein